MTAAPRHPLRARPPARRATDRYIGWGFFGIHLLASLLAVRLAFFAAVPQWHDRWWALAIFAAGLLPLYTAIGIYRYAHARDERARQLRRRNGG